MTEGERITLLNDLCDYEQELKTVIYPSKTRELDIVRRAIAFVRGSRAQWINNNTMCSGCGFAEGNETFKFCPSCGARMRK